MPFDEDVKPIVKPIDLTEEEREERKGLSTATIHCIVFCIIGLIISIIIICFAYTVHAQDNRKDSRDTWWTDKDEGWFFYNERYIPEKEEGVVITRSEPSKDEPLFTEKMQQTGKELMSKAMENPTEENVMAYMEYNKAMLALSDNFSKAWQKLIMKYPHLLFDQGLTYAAKDIEKAIDSLKEEAGLYFIHSSSCTACQKQAKTLKEFEKKYGMTIFPITLDNPLPEYPNAETDNGIAQRLNVTSVPSIFIVFPESKKIELISQGFVDVFELERRLYNYAQPIDKEAEELLTRINNHLSGGSNTR